MALAPLRRRVVVAMSGGVDSSVAAHLLQQDSTKYEVVSGLFMSNWIAQDDDSFSSQQKCYEADYNDARSTCQHLNLPLHYTSFAKEYWNHVFDPMLQALPNNTTPNPDCDCNVWIKFGVMKEYIQNVLGVPWMATGHYARLYHKNQTQRPPEELSSMDSSWKWLWNWHETAPLLLKGVDATKDQSYFLATVPGVALENVDFPLGHLYKNNRQQQQQLNVHGHLHEQPTVRQIAQSANLPTASKKESMGICFVGKRDFPTFLSQYVLDCPGEFRHIQTDQILGHHTGAYKYTIGQGAKLSGAPVKWFVVHRHNTTVYLCPGTHHSSLYSNHVYIREMNWMGDSIPPPLLQDGALRITCRPRHLQPLVSGIIMLDHTNNDGGMYKIMFDDPVRALTPGQVAVLYIGSVCLGGGTIWKAGPSYYEMGLELPLSLHPSGHNDLSVVKRRELLLK